MGDTARKHAAKEALGVVRGIVGNIWVAAAAVGDHAVRADLAWHHHFDIIVVGFLL